MFRWFCWIPAGAVCYPSVPAVGLFLLSTKVDANNMIPKTCLVNSSWLETRKFVNGWFDVTANKRKGLGILLIPSLLCLSLILCLKYLQCFIMSQLSDWQATQYSATHQGLYPKVLRSTSLKQCHVGTCSVFWILCITIIQSVGFRRKGEF